MVYPAAKPGGKGTVAVDGVSFQVHRGEIFGFLGPNGAGKTTTISMLTTLLPPTSGQAQIDGIDVLSNPDEVRRRLGLVFQKSTADEELTGRENLSIEAGLYGLSGQAVNAHISDLLDQMDLAASADRFVKTYSGGMRRRFDLAAGIVVPRDVLFLDEPTTGLDPVSRAQIWLAIREMVTQSGTTVLLTSQYLEEAEQLADDVTVISDGLVAASGTPGQLRESVGQASVRVVLRDARPEAAGRVAALLGPATRIDGRVLVLPAPDGLGSLAGAVARIQPMAAEIDDVALQRPSLEEAFTILTSAGPAADDARPELATAGAR